MKCPDCREDSWNEIDGEMICEKCGSAFALEYLGYYLEGGDERIDEPNPESKTFCTTEDCDNEVKHEGDYCSECLLGRADTIREQKKEDADTEEIQ